MVNKRNYLQYGLADEIMINVFKHVNYTLNLSLSCRKLYAISKDCQAKVEWIIFQYGKAHCLFHAIRLGPTFINVEVAQAIIGRGGILSRYFIQRLLIHFGSYDEKLIKFKIAFNVGKTVDLDRTRSLQRNVRPPWASNLQISVFTFLLSKAYNQLGASDMCAKGNDMELFHFLTAGPYTINRAPNILAKNIECIKDLILRMKFVPIPPRPSSYHLDSYQIQVNSSEEYPSKDGYENNRQLNVIARAILICKDLVHLWKKIGYYEICEDFNDLVMQGALLLLFPPTPSAEWIRPDIKAINARLTELTNIGFQLSYGVIGNIFHLFENRLEEIGETLVESFMEAKNESCENFLLYCLIETIKLDNGLKTFNVWNFFYRLLSDPETIFNKAIDHYYNDIDNDHFVKPLILSPKFYYWVLMKFGTDAQITTRCFENILLIRVSIDQQLKLTPDLNIPIGMSQYAFNETCNIFKVYCNAKNFFQPSHLELISQCFSVEILGTLFGHYLPCLFNLEITFPLPMQITEIIQYDIISPSNNKKRTKRYVLKEWEQKLQSMFDNRNETNSVFQNYLSEFWEKKLCASEIKKDIDISKSPNNANIRAVRRKQRKKRLNETN